jgi:hypothetical protein
MYANTRMDKMNNAFIIERPVLNVFEIVHGFKEQPEANEAREEQ